MSVYQDVYHLPEFNYDYEKLIVKKQGPVYIASFNDADNLNAMSYQQMADFNDFLRTVRLDPDCRVIVLTGEGKSFCAGFNLNELVLDPPEDMGVVQRDFYVMQKICSDQAVNMHNCPQPIIGALKGYAVGGGMSLACCCDLRVLGESFKMNAGYLACGLTGTDMGGSFYLPKIIGYARACEVQMTARRIKAQQLYDWGFGNELVADEEVLDKAIELAEEICKNTSPFGLRLTKEALLTSIGGGSFEDCINMENRNQVLASNTHDGLWGRYAMNPKNRDDKKANPDKYAFHNK